MKTLANCTPREFLKQTNRIRASVEKWLKDTNILEIRERIPKLPEPTKPESKEELEASIKERKDAFAKQTRENFFAILEAMLDKCPDETLELMALVCFIEPSEIDNYTMTQLLDGLTEILSDESVISFFASLAKLAV